MRDNAITRHFFNGFIRLHILYHAAKSPIYGAQITEELVRHGYRLGPGTLYPTLHLLEQLGYLRSHARTVSGRRRKYYEATSMGREVLAESREKLQELVSEVIQESEHLFRTIQQKPRRSGHRNENRL
jgi:DNA-binding PadR family transcriptional regulator